MATNRARAWALSAWAGAPVHARACTLLRQLSHNAPLTRVWRPPAAASTAARLAPARPSVAAFAAAAPRLPLFAPAALYAGECASWTLLSASRLPGARWVHPHTAHLVARRLLSTRGGGGGSLRDRNRNIALYAVALAILTLGGAYAAVPLYRMFCQQTAMDGSTQSKHDAQSKLDKLKNAESLPRRTVKVKFTADVGQGLPWRFVPAQSEINVNVGESALAFFRARNDSSKPIIGVASYNVVPPRAGLYFNKVQCFCFDEQRLMPGEEVDMPVFFFIDTDFLNDARMDNVQEIVLSYTFFPSVHDEKDDETH